LQLFCRFIPNFGETAKALTDLCKKGAKLRWTDIQQLAFDHLKNLLCVAPVLAYPDFNARLYLATDASVIGLGAVIYQLSDGHPLPIAYISHAFSDAELNRGIPEKELYALIYSLEKFKPYIYRPQFTWITDAKCLTWLNRVKDTSRKLLRWCLQIQGIEYSVQLKPGKDNVVADVLSRIILNFASKNTRGYTLPDTLPSTIIAPMLELIVEPYTPFASPDTLASDFVEPSSLVQDRTNAGSDECFLTDLVAAVATVFPDRDGIATAQRADAFFGPILSTLEHTPSVRSPIGNDYAISGDLLYKLPSGSTSKYNQARLCVPNSMVNSFVCSSITTTPLLASILMVCEHTTDCVCCTPGLTWAKTYSRDVSPATRAITRGLGTLILVELCPAHLRLDLLKGYLLT
jgi:RNase H-like domain found in reverse transcriptase